MGIVKRRQRMIQKILKQKQKEEEWEKQFDLDSDERPVSNRKQDQLSFEKNQLNEPLGSSISAKKTDNIKNNNIDDDLRKTTETKNSEKNQSQEPTSPAETFIKPMPGKDITEFNGFEGFEQPEDPHLLTASVIGVPNAGKSTLLNAIIGSKVAATSPKVQTTRNNITGIFTQNNTQVCFVDTPGIVPPERQKKMMAPLVEEAWRTLDAVDVVILVINATRPVRPQLRHISQKLEELKTKKPVVVLNKVDLIHPQERWLEIADELSKYVDYQDVFYTSALLRKGVDIIRDYLIVRSKPGEWIYNPKESVEMSPLERVEEIIREKIFRRFNQEVPYYAQQVNRSWIELSDGSIRIEQDLKMASTGQVKMAIAALPYLKHRAKKDIELALGCRVHLFFRVLKLKKKEEKFNRTVSDEKDEEE